MAGDYSALSVAVTADVRSLIGNIASAATTAGRQAGQAISKEIGKAVQVDPAKASRWGSALGGAVGKGFGLGAGLILKTWEGVGRAALAVGQQVTNSLATGMAVATTAAGALGAAVLKSGVSYNILAQTSRAAFKTILGSAAAADQMMADIAEFAKTSPFPRQVFIAATRQMVSFGISAKKALPYLAAIQDAVAATGGSAQDISEITLIMSQISAAGKITGTDLMQLAQRGINAAQLIGSEMGKTGPQIKDAITAGTLPAGKALDALVAGMNKKFGGAAANVKNTWTGAMDRVKGAMRDIGSIIAAPFIDPKGGGIALTFANKIADGLRALQPAVQPLMDMLMNKIGPAIDKIIAKITLWVDAFKGVGDASGGSGVLDFLHQLGSSLGPITNLIAPLGAGLAALGGANLAKMLGPLGAIVPEISPIVAAIAALVVTTPELRSALTDVFNALKPLLPIVGQLAGVLGKALGQAATALAPIIAQLGGVLADVLGQALTAIGPLISALAPVLSGIAQIAAALLLPIIQALGPVIGTLAQALTKVVAALVPLLPSFTKLSVIIGQYLAAEINSLLPLIPVLADLLVTILQAIGPLLPPLVTLAALLMRINIAFIQVSATVTSFIVKVLAALVTWVVKAVTWLLTLGNDFQATRAKIISALAAAGLAVVKFFLLAAHFFLDFPGIVSRAISAAAQFIIVGIGRAMVFLASRVASGVSVALSFLRSLPGKAGAALSALPGILARAGATALRALGSAIRNAIPSAISAISGIKSRIMGALSGAGSWLTSIGGDIVRGLVSGIGAMAHAVVDALLALIPGPLKKFANLVGIGSPSTLFRDEIGRWIPLGIVAGINKTAPTIDRALAGLVNLPKGTAPFGMSLSATAGLGTGPAARGNTINVYPRESQSEEQIAAVVDRKLAWAQAGGIA